MDQHTWDISTLQVQIFLKAVELKNFTQVARFFNYTPSMVSKTITALENELGIPLFDRKPHELTPTAAAQTLAKEWRLFVGSFNKSIEKALAVHSGKQSRILLGFVDSSEAVDSKVTQAVKHYLANNPENHIIVEKHDMHRAVELLNTGFLDLALTSAIEIPYLEEHGLCWEKILDTRNAVFIPRNNPLFDKDDILPSDLSSQPVLVLDPAMHPGYTSWLTGYCSSFGFLPDVEASYRTVRSLVFSLNLQDAIFIGDSINKDWCDEDLRCVLLPGDSFTLAAWRSDASLDVLKLKDALRQVFDPK